MQINPAIWIGILDDFWLNFGVGGGLRSLNSLV